MESQPENKTFKEQLYEDHPKDPKHFPLWLVLLVLILIGAGAWFGYKDAKTEEQKDKKTLTEAQEVDLSGDVVLKDLSGTDFNTASWQTYRNEEFGFEVKYPEDWFMNRELNELLSRAGRIIIYLNDQQPVDFENQKIILDLQQVDNSSFVEHVRSNKPFSTTVGTSVTNSIIRVDNKEVALQEITYSESSDNGISNETRYEAVIPIGGNTLFLKSLATYKPVLDQIVSTFRFID